MGWSAAAQRKRPHVTPSQATVEKRRGAEATAHALEDDEEDDGTDSDAGETGSGIPLQKHTPHPANGQPAASAALAVPQEASSSRTTTSSTARVPSPRRMTATRAKAQNVLQPRPRTLQAPA